MDNRETVRETVRREEALAAFTRRYPIAGETIRTLVQAYGGIEPFIDTLEHQGFDRELYGWMTARKPGAMKLQQVRDLIPHERVEQVARKTGTHPDSVEIQVAQYLPRLFRTMGENLDGMEFLWRSTSSHSARERPTL